MFGGKISLHLVTIINYDNQLQDLTHEFSVLYVNWIDRLEIEATLELMKKAEHDLNQKQKHLEEWELRLLEKEKKLERKKKYMASYIYKCT